MISFTYNTYVWQLIKKNIWNKSIRLKQISSQEYLMANTFKLIYNMFKLDSQTHTLICNFKFIDISNIINFWMNKREGGMNNKMQRPFMPTFNFSLPWIETEVNFSESRLWRRKDICLNNNAMEKRKREREKKKNRVGKTGEKNIILNKMHNANSTYKQKRRRFFFKGIFYFFKDEFSIDWIEWNWSNKKNSWSQIWKE